jgi:CRP-like cAMP-binding protein
MGLGELKDGHLRGVLVTAIGIDGCCELFRDARPVTFSAKQTIFVEGEPGNSLILIEKGRVEVSNTSLTGRKSVLAHMGPGEVLGEIAALDGGTRSADAVAAIDVSGLALSRENVLEYIAARPELAQSVIVELCRKVRNASQMFATQSIVEGEPRLARGLLQLFEKWGTPHDDGTALAEKFSQQDIGEFSGLARENVNRQIKTWIQAGFLRSEGRTLVLVDREALEYLAEL